MPDADLALLIDAARDAGALARSYFRQSPRQWDKPGKGGPVTEADLATDSFLRETLTAARPQYGWLSEETPDDAARLACETVFIVDPIDGTRAFIEGETAWSVSLAIARMGEIAAAVVFLPALDRLFTALRGSGAWRDGTPLAASSRDRAAGGTLLANRWSMGETYWPGGVPAVKREFRPSLAYRLALIGEGRYDAMVTFRDTWEWDIAAGTLIAVEAGATVTDRHGGTLRFNTPRAQAPGIIAGSPGAHAELLARHR
ncbi:MAG: 3'(2'),5'-bisphosphate nucleotidase CysQ [Rhodobacteraceae bacterium]|nr:3'(2'),5'-bisphosphate nucleotidase CysQ [Paracoccaceae bacterium]